MIEYNYILDTMKNAYFDESDLPSNITRDEFENKWFTDMNYYPQTV